MELTRKEFIVATDNGILHKMQMAAPNTFIVAPTAGNSATCKKLCSLPWMAMNGLRNLLAVLESESNRIEVEAAVGSKGLNTRDRPHVGLCCCATSEW